MTKIMFVNSWGEPDQDLLDRYGRQTPNGSGIWNDLQGTANADQADCFVVLEGVPKGFDAQGKPSLYLKREPRFVEPFQAVRGMMNNDWSDGHCGITWWLDACYDQLIEKEFPKTKKLSAVVSGKYEFRLNYVKEVSQRLPRGIDIFGRGLETAGLGSNYQGELSHRGNCKLGGLADYQYTLAIENSQQPNYWTEKLADAFLAGCMPLYWGCPNIYDFFPKDALHLIDLDSPDEITKILQHKPSAANLAAIGEARELILNNYNIWPTVERILGAFSSTGLRQGTQSSPRKNSQYAAPVTLSKGFESNEMVDTTYYSQHGEDATLDRIFNYKENGVFVEVGCIDGRRFSNSLCFEERGWTGLCIEAHPDYIDLLTQNRPNSIVSACAAGDNDADEITFYANRRGSLSTLDKGQEERFRNDYAPYFSGFEEKSVPLRRLDSLFAEHHLEDIDFVSIDVEGTEVQVLKGIDFSRFRPAVFLIESDSPEQESELDEIMEAAGYHKGFAISCNIFYFRERELADQVEGSQINCELVHTGNPLDGDDDLKVKATIAISKDGVSYPLHIDGVNPADSPKENGFFHKLARLSPLAKNSKVRNWWRKRRRSRNAPQDAPLPLIAPPPKIAKQAQLHWIAELYNLRTFVETGTYLGETTGAMEPHFDHVYTVELSDELFAKAESKFADHPKVSTIHGNSAIEIPPLVKQLTEPTLFWLDGHYSGGLTAGSSDANPIYEELRAILDDLDRFAHVIVIDDARLFGTEEGYPTVDEVIHFVSSRYPKCDISIACDAIRIVPSVYELPWRPATVARVSA